MTHRFPVRVYHEDTDLGGVVYHANHLKFIERGRSELLRVAGVSQSELKDDGILFVVRRIEADYLKPALYDDALDILTRPEKVTPARIVLDQRVERNGETLFAAVVTLACMSRTGRPVRVPREIRAKLSP